MLRQPLRANRQRQQVAQGHSIPAPVGGWDAVSPLAAMPDDRAVVLDNWFPQPGYVEVRRGNQVHAAGMGSAAVQSLMVYHGHIASDSKMFAVTGGTIWDVTASGNATSTGVTGLGSNRWQHVNFETSGGLFLVAVNGTDAVRNYDGSVWSTPTITGTGISSAEFINVAVHKKRLWFVIAGSMNAAYLPTEAIAGTAVKFPLGAVFSKGGYLVAIGTWTRDAGAGPDDYLVLVSSRGQVAVYEGVDPASNFNIVGVYDLGAPIGYRCLTKVAGDIALINVDGVLPLSRALGTDRGAVAQVAITANINNAMNTAARSYAGNFGWELCAYPKGTMALLNVPITETSEQHQYTMNTLTGAWCRFKGWQANCFAVYDDNLYFGDNVGAVRRADFSALDGAEPIDAIGQTAYDYYKARGILKIWGMMQPLITTDSDSRPAVGISTDFADNASLGTPSSAAVISALYDSAVWDVDVYPVEARNIADWVAISGVGQAASIHFRASTGDASQASLWGAATWGQSLWSTSVSGEVIMRLNGFNVTFQTGGYM